MKFFLITLLFICLSEAKIVVTPYMSKQVTTPPNKGLQDDEGIYGLGIRGYITEDYAIDVRLEGSNGNLMEDGGRTDIERGSVNIFYDVYPNSKASNYFFGGMGYEQLHRNYLDIKSQPFFDAGIGVRMNINRNLEVMTEAKYLKKMNTKDSEIIGSFGFGYIFADQVYKEKEYIDAKLPKENISRKKELPQVFVTPEKNSTDINSTLISTVKDDRDKVFLDEIVLAKDKVKENKIKNRISGNYIQVAALTKKKNLKSCIKRLKSMGVKTTVIKNQKSSVVYVGPYAKTKIKVIYRKVKKIYKDAFLKKL